MDDIKIYLADWSIEFIPLMKWSLFWHVSMAHMSNILVINWGASFRWSFGPLSAWGSIESTTIVSTHPSLLEVIESELISNDTQCLSFKINFQAMTFVISPKISEFSSRAQKWKFENSKEARLDWNLRITSAFNSLLVFPISMYALFSELDWYDMFSSCPAAKLRSG